jgi:DNA-binding NtrC family response regulator
MEQPLLIGRLVEVIGMAAPVRIASPRPPSTAPNPSLDALMEQFLQGVAARNGGSPPPLRDWVELAEAWRIARALRRARGNRSAAARELGIGRRTLYTKMEKLGIAPRFSIWD